MLFNTYTCAVIFSFVSLAVAMPGGAPPCTTTLTVTAPSPTVTSISQCNTGNAQCCDSVTESNSPLGASTLRLLDIVLNDVELLGLMCSPISTLPIGGATCSANPVCCTDNSYANLISIGCVPINL